MTDTKKLYFEDAYLTEFDARILAQKEYDGHPAVVLDRTAFYPEAGGQPCDGGTINGVEVLHVFEEGGAVLHILRDGINTDIIHGKIDWPKRFDRMQQHSGQHILSQSFYEVLKGETHSFHLGEEVSTVEIGIRRITDEELDRVERTANAAVFADLEIKTYFVPEEKIGEIPLRRPPQKEGLIRVVEAAGFDYSACGGTHCRRAGEIGLIKVTAWERIRGNLRFAFLCGGRALRDYEEKTRSVRHIAAAFSVSERDIPAAVDKSQAEIKALKKRTRKIEERVAVFEAQEIMRGVQGKIIQTVFDDKSPEEARFLAIQVIRHSESVVLYGVYGGDQSHLILAASENVGLDARDLIPAVTSVLEAKGGGSASLVELVTRDRDKIPSALAAVKIFVKENL